MTAVLPAQRPVAAQSPVGRLTHVFGKSVDTIGCNGRPSRLVIVHCFACGHLHRHAVKFGLLTVKRRASCRLTSYVIVIGEPT